MNKIFFIALIIIVSSCSPKFYLNESLKIDNLRINIQYDESLSEEDVSILSNQAELFIKSYNHNMNRFNVELASDSIAEIIIIVENVKIPSKFFMISSMGISLSSVVLLAKEPQIGAYTIPLIYMHTPRNFSRCRYIINSEISNMSDRPERKIFYSQNKWNNKDIERKRHLRHFNIHLNDFIDEFEKEYIKKNGL